MRSKLTVVLALCTAEFALAEETMSVAICNLGKVPDSVIATAQAETEFVFRAASIKVVWAGCEETLEAAQFIIRLRADAPPRMAGPTSLHAMGKAYVPVGGAGGYLVNAYWQAIEAFVVQQEDAGALLGLVMAHELGHLLRGAGHSPDGVMRAVWTGNTVEELRKRNLTFNKTDAARIRRDLQTR